MKKWCYFLPLLLMTTSLSGCIFDDDSWKEDYGTPETLLNTVLNDLYIPRVYLYEDEKQTEDEDYVITNYILKAGPFEETKQKQATSEKYFTFEAFWQPATSGPNYCNMQVYDDGYIVINHKKSLGRLQSVYFSMDSVKSLDIVEFVFNRINN